MGWFVLHTSPKVVSEFWLLKPGAKLVALLQAKNSRE
jgi:hypothetical protein